MYEKIVQIMPAPKGLRAVYEDEGRRMVSRIVCLGLTMDGGVCFMDYDEDGNISIVDEISNFVKVVTLNE